MMTPDARLRLLAVVILLSAVYAVLVQQDRDLAYTLSIGYLVVITTASALVHLWRKP